MALVEKQFRALYGTLFIIFILFGTSMTIIGATLPKILSDFSWSYTTAGAVIAAGAIGYFLSTYAAGFLVSIIGPRLTIMLGLGLEIAGLFLFAATPSPLANLLLYLGIGIGQGCIELTVNWSTLRMDRTANGRAMNLMHGAFAVGAFTGPFVIGILIRANLSWTLIYRFISLLFVGVFVVLFFMPFSALGKDEGHGAQGSRRALYTHPAYWLGFLALLFYVGVELGVSNWIAEYFVTVFKATPSTGSFMVSLFWLGLLIGRFGVPIVYHGERRERVLMIMAVLMSASVISLSIFGFVGSGSSVILVASAFSFLAGLGCSIVYPIVVTIVGSAFPRSQSEAVAFSAMGGGLGAFVFPFLMSYISGTWGIRLGFTTYAFFSVVVVLISLALIRVTKGEKA